VFTKDNGQIDRFEKRKKGYHDVATNVPFEPDVFRDNKFSNNFAVLAAGAAKSERLPVPVAVDFWAASWQFPQTRP